MEIVLAYGVRWHRSADGYYRNTTHGALLHRWVYTSEIGPIPDGYEIHHVDGDRRNNDPTNLEAVSKADHRRAHPRDADWHRAGTRAAHANGSIEKSIAASRAVPKELRAERARRGWATRRES